MVIFVFILIVVVILVLFYINGINEVQTDYTASYNSYSTPTTNINNDHGAPLLYKKRGIKSFDMKGMYYQDLSPHKHVGGFIGYAECDFSPHDSYSVAIFSENGELLGYTPKGNRRLNNSLLEWNNGKVSTWGTLFYDYYDDRWSGQVNVPVGYTDVQMTKLKRALDLIALNKNEFRTREKSTDKFFEILKRHEEIQEILSELKNPKELEYSFPKNIIPSISSHLEKEQNWEKLIELEKYQELILQLNEKYLKTTLERIRKAKKNVA